MGERLVGIVITYLDTAVAIWLAQGAPDRLSPAATHHLDRAANLRISPAVLLELEFLHEIGRVLLSATDIRRKLEIEAGITVCELGFLPVIETALRENWTRDPFDRMITAHARSNALAWLVTSDRRIREAYPRVIW
jgi:PIN domain nuclease of toxin-antitoxin system